ncbi:MAG: hypothetical protein ACR2QW_15575 [bacterium]
MSLNYAEAIEELFLSKMNKQSEMTATDHPKARLLARKRFTQSRI